MMGDALVSAVASTILDNISSLLLEEFGISGGLKTELEKMQSTFTAIQAVLLDAEEKQWTSKTIKNWLRKLKDTAYEVEDILDDFAANTPGGSQVSTLISLPKQLLFRSKIAHRLRDVREKLDAIAEERSKFHLTEGIKAVEDRQVGDREWRETSSLVTESEVVGRHTEVEKVINMVLNNSASDQDGVSVYAIWGMGGLGKTTLAQLVYNNQSVGKAFDLRIWVCVSDDFDIKKLTKAIIESIGGYCILQDLDPLQRHLQEKLSGKRFLLVLDDVWNEYEDKWDGLKEAFKHCAKGSTVMVTTRGENVAYMMTTAPNFIHHLGCLSEDDSWSLFKQRAFRMGKIEDYPELEALGKEIVNKCGGVPLAIKALGSLMSSKERVSEWLAIKESNMWDLADEGSRVFEVLRLSYRHLKSHLRQCFAFCSLFPKDSILVRDRLIQLWMANGFVPLNGHVNLHDAGCQIFNELAKRSFFQEIEENWEGDVTCKMHDLIHDLAQSILGSECCVVERGQVGLTVPKTVRHMLIARNGAPDLHNVNSLRSLIVQEEKKEEEELYLKIATKQKHLRALQVSLPSSGLMKFSFSNFKHIRYLNISSSYRSTLPESINNLHNLQTLNLRDCFDLCTLPNGLKHLKGLIYLDIRDCYSLTCMPDGLGELSCLRVLSKFIVGKDHGCYIDELKEMALEGELCIEGLDNVKSSIDARSANLNMKHNLRSVSLEWQWRRENNYENDEDVLCGLQPHPNLRKLSIRNYQGPKFSNWLMDLLVPNLVVISLMNCGRCECLPPLGKLSFLKVLVIRGMDALKSIDSSFYGDGETSFPSLEKLRVMDMPCLEEWRTVNDGRETFSLLTSLGIDECPKLVEIPPVFESLKRLLIKGNSSISSLASVMHLTSLTSLSVGSFEDLTILPEGVLQHHKHLEKLTLISLPRLKSLSDGLDNLSALKLLYIHFCYELESLPAGLEKLSSLERLELKHCDSLVSLPEDGLRGLSSLSNLWIQKCEKLECLSEGVRYLTSLQHLTIIGCREFKSLPESIQHLASLSSLWIDSCENLMSLPRGLQSLTALTQLTITNCPNVERRCKAEGGEDWPFIAHIPGLDIR